jgi:hypothetical protein
LDNATDELRGLAREIYAAASERVHLRAALLAGSAGRGDADVFSDIDLLFYVDLIPQEDVLTEIRLAVGGTNPIRRSRPTEHHCGEEFEFKGVRTEVSFTTVSQVESLLDRLLVQLDEVASPLQKIPAGLLEGLPLSGEELIEGWRARLRAYPEPLRREMIERHWNFFPSWYHQEAMSGRDAELWRIEMLLDGAFNLLGVLAGLNRVYFSRFELKRMHALVNKMELTPPRLAERLESLFRLTQDAAADELGRLVSETRELVAVELPDLDLTLRFPPGTHQLPWSSPRARSSRARPV